MTRRTVWLGITSLVLGPAFGGLTFMVAAGVTDPGASGDALPLEGYWPIIVTAAYILGAGPALISAIIMAIATRWLPAMWQRMLVAPMVGALISIAILNLILFSDGHGTIDDWMITGVVAMSGAVAGTACLAIVELFHPLPLPEKVAT